MNTYTETKEGSYLFNGMSIPNAEGNRHYRQMLLEISNGEGTLTSYVEPVPTPEEKIAAIRDSVGSHIETIAKSAGDFGFDSILSAVSYVGGDALDVNVIYGTALFNYREACWETARLMLVDWQTGGAEFTPEEAVAQMPLWSDFEPEV